MAEVNTKKYLSLTKLGLYDEKIKAYIATKDGETLASAKSYADSLASNYDAAGSAATALTEAKAYADGKDSAIAAAKKTGDDAQKAVDALSAKVGTVEEGSTVVGLVEAAQTAADAAQADVDALETKVGTVPEGKTVVKMIEEAQTASTYDDTEVRTLIAGETTRAKGVEDGLDKRIKAVEDDHLVAADKTELVNTINTNKDILDAVKEDVDAFFKDADMSAQAKDTLKEIQDYIDSDASAAAEMTASIKKNADAVKALDTKVGAIPEGATSNDVVSYVLEKVGEEKSRAEGVEGGLGTRITSLEGKLGDGDGSVSSMIADAKAEAIATAAIDATTKADQALKDAKKYADDEDAKIEGRVDTLEAASHTHANKALLDTYKQTEANLADAVAKKHSHANATVLDGITSAKVAAWDKVGDKADASALTAETTARTSADDALDAKITANTNAINSFIEVSEEEINALFA